MPEKTWWCSAAYLTHTKNTHTNQDILFIHFFLASVRFENQHTDLFHNYFIHCTYMSYDRFGPLRDLCQTSEI